MIINIQKEMISLLQGIPQLENKVFTQYPQTPTSTPMAILYIVSRTTDAMDTDSSITYGEFMATFRYSVDVYADTEEERQNIMDSVKMIYIQKGILCYGETPIFDPNRDVSGISCTFGVSVNSYGQTMIT